MEVLILFILGLFFGSFFLVIIDRIPRGKNPLTGRSVCDSCGHVIAWYNLIPVVSFLALKGKCRFCRAGLSLYYPLVELVTGVLFALTPLLLGLGAQGEGVSRELLFSLFIVSTFIIIFFIDLKYGIIPFAVVIPASIITVLYYAITNSSSLLPVMFSGTGAGIFFFLIFLITRGKGMGFGDVILSMYIGLLLGFSGTIAALYIAFLTGALLSLILILMGRKKLKGGTIPFGPFLILGTYISFFWRDAISSYIYRLFS